MTKPGRPALGDRPMTSSERNRRRMDRLREAERERDELRLMLAFALGSLDEYARRFGALENRE